MALNVVEIWRDLHKTPELGFEEKKTSAYLAEALEKLGYAVTRGVGKTGVMGVIRGAEPGPVLMLRADMDALPFRNDDGSIEAVHACGHDSHCAMVLAAASELAGRVRRGTLKILFQPGEETLHGALEVLKSGAVYDEDLVAELAGTIREVLGDECLARDCGGGGEDFHFFKKERPHIRAAYFGVGAGCTPGLHARNMTFDETQLDMGVRVLTAAALKHVG